MNFIKPLAIYLSLASAVTLSAGSIKEEILVTVNNNVITSGMLQQEVNATLNEASVNNAIKLRSAKEEALRNLIDLYVLTDKANSLGLAIDEAFNSYLGELKEKHHISSTAELELAIKDELGLDMRTYRNRWQYDAIKNHLAHTELMTKIIVAEQELQNYYKEHEADFKQHGSFHIRELILPQGRNEEEQKNTMTKLAIIQDKFKQGTDFAALIGLYSIAASRSTGGDLGWVSKDTLHTALEKAISTLKDGQITNPILIDNNIYLIQLLAAKNDYLRPFADLRETLLQQLKDAKLENALETYMQSLRMHAHIRYLVPKNSILNEQ